MKRLTEKEYKEALEFAKIGALRFSTGQALLDAEEENQKLRAEVEELVKALRVIAVPLPKSDPDHVAKNVLADNVRLAREALKKWEGK